MVVEANDLGLTPESIEMFSETDAPIVAAEPGSPESAEGNPPAGDQQDGNPPAGTPPAGEPSGEPATPQNNLSPFWKKLETDVKAVDPEYKIPEIVFSKKKEDGSALSEDEEFELLRQEINRFTEDPVQDDPFVASYLAAKQAEDFDYVKWISEQAQAYSFMNAPSKELVLQAFRVTNEQQKKGWTEENMISFVDGMNPIDLDLKADAIRASFSQTLNKQSEVKKAEEAIQRQNYIETLNKRNLELAPTIYAEVDKLSNFGGIPHGETEKAEFRPFFEKLIQINPETGEPFTNDLFSDDITLYKALFLLHAADKGLISNFKEEFKSEILNKTELNKRTEKTGSIVLPAQMNSEDFI